MILVVCVAHLGGINAISGIQWFLATRRIVILNTKDCQLILPCVGSSYHTCLHCATTPDSPTTRSLAKQSTPCPNASISSVWRLLHPALLMPLLQRVRITPAATNLDIFARIPAFFMCSCKAAGSPLACCKMLCMIGSCNIPMICTRPGSAQTPRQ